MSATASQFPTEWKTELEWHLDAEGIQEKDRRQIYTFSTFVHEGIHIGIMSVLEYPRDVSEGGIDTDRKHHRDVLQLYLIISRDGVYCLHTRWCDCGAAGIHWNMDWIYAGETLLERGNSWDKDYIIPAPSFVTFEGKHWLYYCGGNERHEAINCAVKQSKCQNVKRKIGVSTTLQDRFAYFSTIHPNSVGHLLTKVVIAYGDGIAVNAIVKGQLWVEIIQAGTIVAISKRINNSDSVKISCVWEDGFSWKHLDGVQIQLKFYLADARLYAFEFIK